MNSILGGLEPQVLDTQDLRDVRSGYVNVDDSNLPVLAQGDCKVRSHGALSHAPLAAHDDELVLHPLHILDDLRPLFPHPHHMWGDALGRVFRRPLHDRNQATLGSQA